MKATRNMTQKTGITLAALTFFTCISCAPGTAAKENPYPQNYQYAQTLPLQGAGAAQTNNRKKIKIALLLDTSNSMDGLIEQAKSQLWKLVNELSLAKCGNEKPQLEIALYEYGNDRLSGAEGYIRQVSLFTGDLDLISEKLFSLTTNGGSEFCGYVINSSLSQLDWAGNDNDLRIIFIAGNEPFNQGPVNPVAACNKAKQKDVTVNTIYCGDFTEGLRSGWKNGALITGGEYMSIEQNRKTIYIETPYDTEIAQLNEQINSTYVSYGKSGSIRKQNQSRQDANAASYGVSNVTERIVSKTSSFYSNAEWDIVDASKEKTFDVTKIKEEDLPAELKGKTREEKEKYITVKKEEREQIKKKIADLNRQRVQYITEKQKTPGDTGSLDAAMLKAIKEQAVKKKFEFES